MTLTILRVLVFSGSRGRLLLRRRDWLLGVEPGGGAGLEQWLLRTSEGLSVKGIVSPDSTGNWEFKVGATCQNGV